MDGDLEQRVMQAIFGNLHPQGVAVVVTHKISLLQHVGRVIVMDRGRVVMDGPRDAVLEALRKGTKQAATHAQIRTAGSNASPAPANEAGRA
jgi:ATP-binding cassette subfamily C protein LapB